MAEDLETRVTVLERELQELKDFVTLHTPKGDWKSTYGAMADDEVYDEVLKLGAEIRRGERESDA